MGLPQENIDLLKSPVPTQKEIAQAIIEDLKEEEGETLAEPQPADEATEE